MSALSPPRPERAPSTRALAALAGESQRSCAAWDDVARRAAGLLVRRGGRYVTQPLRAWHDAAA